MKKHYFAVKIEKIEVTDEQGLLLSSNDVFSIAREFKTRAEAENFVRERSGYYLLVLEG